MATADAILDALASRGYRVTSQRRALSALVAARSGHFSADELLVESRARHLGIGRATVFRSLDVLAELGVVEQIDLPSGGHAFVACTAAHHHHLVCERCGRSTDISATGLSAILREIGTRSGYEIESHRLEVFGICPACQAAARPA